MRQTRKLILFANAKNHPHPERENDPEKADLLISEWDLRVWKFKRAVELIIFQEDPEFEEYEELRAVKEELENNQLPEEYYLYLIGAFDKYPLDLPVNWLLAREIIKEVQSVQNRNEEINRQSRATLGKAGA
jgi:hypothetical protein